MRGENLTPAAKSTLVHELTHALQDQHFDLGERYDSFDEDEGSAESAYQALVEGDASRIETAYVEDLPAKEQEQIRKAQQDDTEEFEEETQDLPKILSTVMGAPYVLGEAMLDLALELDDNDAVDELFAKPPVNEEHLLDPWTVVDDRETAVKVSTPKLEDGEEEFDRGEFGALTWYLMLAERLPFDDALQAASGWGGDRYLAFERDGTSCVRVAYVGDAAPDNTELELALRHWMAALPDSSATIDRNDDGLTFESCDPGTATDVGKDDSDEALGFALSRTYLGISFMKEMDVPPAAARCVANTLLQRFTLEEINDDEYLARPSLRPLLSEIGRNCASA